MTGSKADTGTYQVWLSGDVSGHSFARPATLVVTESIDRGASSNGVNAIDVCLSSGNPYATPASGAIAFGSNTGCLPAARAQDIDMVFLEVNGGEVTIRPDATMLAVGLNAFTVTASVTSPIYMIETGEMRLSFDGDAVAGTIDVIGFCSFCTGGAGGSRGRYQAALEGRRTP